MKKIFLSNEYDSVWDCISLDNPYIDISNYDSIRKLEDHIKCGASPKCCVGYHKGTVLFWSYLRKMNLSDS